MYTIIYQIEVIKVDIPRLPLLWKKKIQNAIIQKLGTSPEHFGKPLQNTLANYRRLRVGNYRVIFRIEGTMIKIFMIEHRNSVYQKILKRLYHGRT